MFDWTSQNAVIGMVAGAVFGNCFPFPAQWWTRCQTPVGIMLVVTVGWFFYQAQ